jgi:hypothetical protein
VNGSPCYLATLSAWRVSFSVLVTLFIGGFIIVMFVVRSGEKPDDGHPKG